jgi:hypothetical protein
MIDEFACVFGFVGVYICMTFLKRRIVKSEMSTTGDGYGWGREMARYARTKVPWRFGPMAHNLAALNCPDGSPYRCSNSAESA